jgi:hypothetical protein
MALNLETLSEMSFNELKDMTKAKELPTTGNKADLIDRLVEAEKLVDTVVTTAPSAAPAPEVKPVVLAGAVKLFRAVPKNGVSQHGIAAEGSVVAEGHPALINEHLFDISEVK